jgi:Restriction endonuclease
LLGELVAPWRVPCPRLSRLKEGDNLLFHEQHGSIPVVWERRPINRHWTAGRAVVDCKPVHVQDLTRPSRDGGRDGIGKLNIGRGPSALLDFALEAKCYGEGNSVGVREMSRLISRLRGRFEIGCQTCSSSSSAFACFKSSVSKPSLNQT